MFSFGKFTRKQSFYKRVLLKAPVIYVEWFIKRFEILELQNRVTKPSYAKWRHTSDYYLESFFSNFSFDLLTQLHKILN